MCSATIDIKIKKNIFTIIFVLILMAHPVFADSIGKFTDIRGDVSLERLKMFIKPKINDVIQVKDLVITGDYGRTKLMLIDSSLLTIGNNSKVEITDFLLDVNLRKGIILIKAGALHTRAEKFLEINSRFEVRTPTAVIGARGTEWFTEINAKEGTTVFSIADVIRVYNPAYPNQPVNVKDGYFTVIEKGKLPTKPEPYCPSDLYIIMKKWGAEEGLNNRKLKVSDEICNRVR
ncbi:MAG TPA: FecR family protein [Syntrophorhabdaceae bacterium]|mgnify:CR=1 FL=1|nr:FecR family protein [Syntrophorhabdaceae bacterium]